VGSDDLAAREPSAHLLRRRQRSSILTITDRAHPSQQRAAAAVIRDRVNTPSGTDIRAIPAAPIP
jgi:hypothetical protein